ncbi:MAG: hypothetical protein J7450_08365 [Thermomicrobium sp.]|uniref:hypothetical protein n=1 Tax=Thermomicrobium sp. TaxID=1969469 RepID=UPI001B165C4D|nr:hypothetical protein [Thermomicrobium sp.]MBO9359556.1 hypothetical protein [Thermomicrobium sp.]
MSVHQMAEPTLEAVRHAREAIEYCYERGWTDGLPVVPPAEEFVAEFLAQTDRDPEEVVIEQEHLGRMVTEAAAAQRTVRLSRAGTAWRSKSITPIAASRGFASPARSCRARYAIQAVGNLTAAEREC